MDASSAQIVSAMQRPQPWSAPAAPQGVEPGRNIHWDESVVPPTTKTGKPIEYDPLKDKFLKFHRKPRDSSIAQARLQKQRDIYNSLLKAGGSTEEAMEELSRNRAIMNAERRARDAAHGDRVSPDEVSAEAQERLYLLWEELGVPEDHRHHIRAVAFDVVAPTAETIAILHEEIERCASLRTVEKAIAKAIDVREGFVYLLQELVERISRTKHVQQEAKHLITQTRDASFTIVEHIQEWRDLLGYPAVYMWRGVSYLMKMSTDLHFLVGVPRIQKTIGCAVVGNPLLNPARQLELPPASEVTSSIGGAAAPQRSKMLPPIRTNVQSAVTLAHPPEKFEEVEGVLRGEAKLYMSYLETAGQKTFDPIDAAHADPTVLRMIDEIRFDPDEWDIDFWDERAEREATLNEAARKEIMQIISIQKLFRGALDRRRARVIRQRVAAATKIQSMYRRWAARSEMLIRKQNFQAARRIQAVARGGITREHRQLENELHWKATVIQRTYRGHCARRNVEILRAVHLAAAKIQARWKGYISRANTARTKSTVQHTAAVEIQRIWKGNQLRARKGTLYGPRHKIAAIRLQCWVRRILAIRVVAKERQRIHAATKIQAMAKGSVVRRQAQEGQQEQRGSVSNTASFKR